MALYYDLPVYKDAYRLILKIFEYTKDFSRGHKHAGEDPERDSTAPVGMTTTGARATPWASW